MILSHLSHRSLSLKVTVPVILLLLSFSFIGIRGGLQNKSIHIQNAFTQGFNELGHLTLNTPYYFLRTFNSPQVPLVKWFSDVELERHIRSLRQKALYKGLPRQNVVVIILESFSLEYVEEGYTPFLVELGKQGKFFTQHFANGRRSIEVLASLFDAIPSLQEVPFSKSPAQAMALDGLATTLKANGYETHFFHGASRGSMGFESYTLSHGFDHYYGREDYPGPKSDDDGKWGIFDGPFLDFSLTQMQQMKEPFLTGIFTLSSHQPYSVPQNYQNRFPKGKLEIHESVGYVDQVLREFFEKAKQQSWYENTLFVITADHTQKMHTQKFLSSTGLYRVPLILFHPKHSLAAVPDRVTQHIDVPATILDFVEISPRGIACGGETVLNGGVGRAVHFLQPGWQYIKGDRLCIWSQPEESQNSRWDAKTGIMTPDSESDLVRESQYYLQYYLHGFRFHKFPFVCSE
jgi:phosphoglycerol transferase MdoB-like AlkP superfamily enzyme